MNTIYFETISPFVPSALQLYQWLLEAVDLPEKVLVKNLLGWGKMSRLWCGKQVVSSRNIPGVNPSCVYYNSEMETASHMFM